MPKSTLTAKLAAMLLLALALGGCATTYVPISWYQGKRVQRLSRSDQTLSVLYEHYDPQRKTLRVSGNSFDEAMWPSEVKYHLGAYRKDSQLIYSNLYQSYSDPELRDLMLHEFAHHIWFQGMNQQQREQWMSYLAQHPSPLQQMVRSVYSQPEEYDTEDFAFTIEYARPSDIQELAKLNLITPQESDQIVAQLKGRQQAESLPASIRTYLEASLAPASSNVEKKGTPSDHEISGQPR